MHGPLRSPASCGTGSRGGAGNATAHAHVGPIPKDAKPGSLEFFTSVKPKANNRPGYAYWEAGLEDGVKEFEMDGEEWASIPIIAT